MCNVSILQRSSLEKRGFVAQFSQLQRLRHEVRSIALSRDDPAGLATKCIRISGLASLDTAPFLGQYFHSK